MVTSDTSALDCAEASPRLSSDLATVDERAACEAWAGPSVRCGVAEELGSRQTLEDANLAIDDLGVPPDGQTPCAFYAVFDGHGGKDAAVFAREHLLAAVTRSPDWWTDVPAALRAGFAATDEALRLGGAPGGSGTTALACVLVGRTLTVANAGDCRAVLCRRGRSMELSADHKPSSESEAERIRTAGGYVDGEGYLNGCVGVSRALGDWALHCASAPGVALKRLGLLSGEPEVRVHELSHEDEFLLLACDGLWDVLSSQGAVELARQQLRQHNDPARLAQELAREALRRHSGDNVTVLAVCLSLLPPPSRPPPLSSARPSGRIFRSISQEALTDVQRHLNADEQGGETESPIAG